MEEHQTSDSSLDEEMQASYSTHTSDTGSLSPIKEMDENVLNESSFLSEKENVNTSLVDSTLYTTSLDFSNITLTSEEQVDLSLRAKQPETPPEVLRERLSGLRKEYEYLASEHDELVEYTKLEKQVCHSDCVSKEMVEKQEHLLETLSSSIESLKNENESLHTSLIQKDNDIKTFENKLATFSETYKNTSNIISSKLSTILEDECKEIVPNTSSLDNLLNNNDVQNKENVISHKNNKNTLGSNIANLLNEIDLVIVHHFQTKSSLKQSKLDQQKLDLEKTATEAQMEMQQKEVSFLKTENQQMEETMSYLKDKLEEMTTVDLSKSVELENLKNLLNKETIQMKQLKKQIENTVTLDDVQKEFKTIFHELCNCLQGVNTIQELQLSFSSLSSNSNLISIANLIMDDSSQISLCKLIDKIDSVLRICIVESEISKSNSRESNHRIALLEKEIDNLKDLVSVLKLEITENLNVKVSTLENTFEHKETIYKQDQLKFACLEAERTALEKMVDELKCTLRVTEDQLKLSETTKNKIEKENADFKRIANLTDHENCRQALLTYVDLLKFCDDSDSLKDCLSMIREGKELVACMNPFLDQQTHETFAELLQNLIEKTYYLSNENESLKASSLEHDNYVSKLQNEIDDLKETMSQTKNNSCQYCLKELKHLRELIATEIETLDQEDTIRDLLNYSSIEMFSKLMQNIINKETEFKEDIERRYQEDLQKAKQDVEESKNRRLSQEFWVVELQNENDAINTELTSLKCAKNELETKIKMLFNEIKTADSEMSMLKCKQTELIVEKDTLLAEVNSLKQCLEAEKNKSAEFEGMSIEHSKCMSCSKLKESNLEKEENSDYTRKCDTSSFYFDAEYNGSFDANSEHQSYSSPKIQHLFPKTPKLSKTKNNFDNLMSDLNKERAFLTEVINDIDNECFGENILANADHLTISRDIVKLLGERFSKIEQSYISNLAEFQNDLDNLKSNIVTLYECISTDNPVFDETSSDLSSGFNVMVGNELKFIKDECINISNFSRDIEQTAQCGQMFIQKLKEEFQKVKRDVFEKESLVKKLEKTILNESLKSLELENEAKHVKTKLNSVMLENSSLQEQLTQLDIQVTKAKLKISTLGIDFPTNITDLDSKLYYLVEIFKKEINTLKNECEENEENANFLAYHLAHLLPYLHQLELKSTAVRKVSKAQCLEIKNIKQMLSLNEKELKESNLLINQIIKALPSNSSTCKQPVEMINHILFLLRKSEEEKARLAKELSIKDQAVSNQLQDLNSTNKLTSNLKLQLSEYEEQIRCLRSEVRRLRLKSQIKPVENIEGLSTHKTSAQGVQTGVLCCQHVQNNIELNKRLESQGSVITDLKLQIQQGSFLFEEKTKQLERALRHAKERIGVLNHQLTQQKNYVKDLAEQQRLLGASGDNSPRDGLK